MSKNQVCKCCSYDYRRKPPLYKRWTQTPPPFLLFAAVQILGKFSSSQIFSFLCARLVLTLWSNNLKSLNYRRTRGLWKMWRIKLFHKVANNLAWLLEDQSQYVSNSLAEIWNVQLTINMVASLNTELRETK